MPLTPSLPASCLWTGGLAVLGRTRMRAEADGGPPVKAGFDQVAFLQQSPRGERAAAWCCKPPGWQGWPRQAPAPIAGRRLPRSAGLGPGRGHSAPGVGGPSSPYTCWAKTPPKESGGFSVPHNAENSDGLFPHCHSNHTFFSVSSLLLCVGWCEMDIRFSNTSHKSF